MKQAYKLQNGRAKLSNKTVFENSRHSLSRRTRGKIKLAPTYVFPEQFSNELLRRISVSGEREFFDAMDSIYLDKCQNLYEPEENVEYLYFPESAVISEFQILENGKTVEISMTGREGMVGINSVFGLEKAQNFSQVLIPGRALRIGAEFFLRQMESSKYFQKNVFDFINKYISQISQRVVCNNHHSTEERLCLWLLMITERCGRSVLPLTQEQIARFLGVHRPSVTLITQTLRTKGVIDYVRGKISITGFQKLENAACACYGAMIKN